MKQSFYKYIKEKRAGQETWAGFHHSGCDTILHNAAIRSSYRPE